MDNINWEKFFPVEEYYIRFVQPINPRKYFIGSSGKMVCPCHPDVNPSLGIIRKKEYVLVHCFGCGFCGDIIKLHKGVMKRLFHKYLSDEDVKKDLCRIFNIDYNKLPREKKLSDYDKDLQREMAIIQAEDNFSVTDYQRLILQGKRDKRSIGYYNSLMVSMISQNKKGEED